MPSINTGGLTTELCICQKKSKGEIDQMIQKTPTEIEISWRHVCRFSREI